MLRSAQPRLSQWELKTIEMRDQTKTIKRILIVDDSPMFARMFRAVLVAAGFDVTVETDSRRALAAVIAARESDQPFNLIISDKCMPHIDGPTLLAGLRRDFRDMKTIITSTSVKSGDAAPFADLAVGKSMDIGTMFIDILCAVEFLNNIAEIQKKKPLIEPIQPSA